MASLSPFLWFDDQAEDAAAFYVSVFRNSKLGNTTRYDAASAKASGRPEGSALTVNFELEDVNFTALNGGPVFKFNESISFVITCEDQAEIDYYWGKLSAVPESEQCGWLKDKFGVSWQVVPKDLDKLISRPAAMAAMLQMKKLDVAALKAAR